MKAAFRVLKARPRISVVLTRDSVCAGDDCDAHEKTVEVSSFVDPEVFAREISSGYLPSVAGRSCLDVCPEWSESGRDYQPRDSSACP